MQLFKQLLKEALSRNAIKMQICTGSPGKVFSTSGIDDLTSLGSIAPGFTKELSYTILAGDSSNLNNGKAVNGSMTIAGVGDVGIICDPTKDFELSFYFSKDGLEMQNKHWESISGTAVENAEPFVSPSAGIEISKMPSGSSAAPSTTPPGIPPPPPPPPIHAPTPSVANQEVNKSAEAAEEIAPPEIDFRIGVSVENADDSDSITNQDHSIESPSNNNDDPIPGGFNLDFGEPAEPEQNQENPGPQAPSTPEQFSTAPANDPIGLDFSTPSAEPPVEKYITDTPPPPVAHIVSQPNETHQTASPKIEFSAAVEGDIAAPPPGGAPIDQLLRDMISQGASDAHLTANEPLCFRIDGQVKRVSDTSITPALMEKYLIPIMPETNKAEFAKTNDTDFAYSVEGLARFRVNMFRDRQGVGAVLRQIPSDIPTAKQLGLPEAILKFTHLSKGLVLVTGPTGSGKSTTLAAMMDTINKTRPDHIITIEDPIEFVYNQERCLINQREIRTHTDSFNKALKAALREDPDILLVGELRDLETIAIAIEMAETGHLVFGTLHTTTAVSTIQRIIDQFPADQQSQVRTMLSESLKGVVSQTLLRKKGGGRVAAQEILVVNKAVSNLIREEKTHMIENHMQTKKKEGNQTLTEVLLNLVKNDTVEPIEAYMKAAQKAELVEKFKSNNIPFSLEKLGIDPED